MKTMRILTCEDSLEGILSAVHRAYMSRYGHDYITIEAGENIETRMFVEYEAVATDYDKAFRVVDSIKQKISNSAYKMVLEAAMSNYNNKADEIYRFLILGFKMGTGVVNHLSDNHVNMVFKMSRSVTREYDRLLGFVRFAQLENGLLFSKLGPKHNQLPLFGNHFADRYPQENWMIYDEKRHIACVHPKGSGWFMSKDLEIDEDAIKKVSADETQFGGWWKLFVRTIEINERRNPRCQMNMMPKMYWHNMNELN